MHRERNWTLMLLVILIILLGLAGVGFISYCTGSTAKDPGDLFELSMSCRKGGY